MRKFVPLWMLMLAVAVPAMAQSDSQRGPSTAEERKRFVEITKKLEQNPLDEKLYADRDWAMKWLEDIPDINVSMCNTLLGDLGSSGYKYGPQIGLQFGLGMAVFIIEHPNQATDVNAQYLAGVESALRAYKAILKVKPGARSDDLDELLDRQAQGKLREVVRERAQECAGGDVAT